MRVGPTNCALKVIEYNSLVELIAALNHLNGIHMNIHQLGAEAIELVMQQAWYTNACSSVVSLNFQWV